MLASTKATPAPRADVRRDHRAGEEVIKHVAHDRDLLDPAAHVGVACREDHDGGAVVGMVHAFQLETRTDEVVADLAADGPAGIHDVALIVQQPIEAALGADIEARIRGIGGVEPRRLSVGRGRQRESRCDQKCRLVHDQSPLDGSSGQQMRWNLAELQARSNFCHCCPAATEGNDANGPQRSLHVGAIALRLWQAVTALQAQMASGSGRRAAKHLPLNPHQRIDRAQSDGAWRGNQSNPNRTAFNAASSTVGTTRWNDRSAAVARCGVCANRSR